MAAETVNRIKLGIFVTVGVLLLVAGLYFIGDQKNMFSRSITIHTYFENIGGLRTGNNVRFSGIEIGIVDKVKIEGPTHIRVSMVIEEKMKKFIRINSTAVLGTDGLMGGRLVNIIPGTEDMPEIEDDAIIESRKLVDTDEMMLVLDKTNRNISKISEELLEVTGNLNNHKGTFYSLLLDTNVAIGLQNTLSNISDISINLKGFSSDLLTLSENMKSGKGVLGSLVEDSSETHMQLNHSIQNILTISNNLNEFAIKLNNTMDSIQNSQGSLSVLLYDTLVANKLRASMTNIDSVTAALPEYMNALKGNFLFRKYFRKKEAAN